MLNNNKKQIKTIHPILSECPEEKFLIEELSQRDPFDHTYVLKGKSSDGHSLIVHGQYSFSLEEDYFYQHKDLLDEFLRTHSIYDEPFDLLADQARLLRTSHPEVLAKFASSRDYLVEGLLDQLSTIPHGDKLSAISEAYFISIVNEVSDAIKYDVHFHDLMSNKLCTSVDVSVDSIDVDIGDDHHTFNFTEQYQDTPWGTCQMYSNPKRIGMKGVHKKVLESKMQALIDYPSFKDLEDMIEKFLPGVRRIVEDSCYMKGDRYSIIPRDLMAENWIYRGLCEVIDEQDITFMVVADMKSSMRHWYSRLAYEKNVKVSEYHVGERIVDAVFLVCPFSLVMPAKSAPPYVNGMERDTELYRERHEAIFLQDKYPGAELASMRIYASQVLPVPLQIIGRHSTKSPGKRMSWSMGIVEDFCYYSVSPHRTVGLFVQGLVRDGGDIWSVGDSRSHVGAFYMSRFLVSYRRNEDIFKITERPTTYNAIFRASRVESSSLKEELTRLTEKFYSGTFFLQYDKDVSHSPGVTEDLGVLLRAMRDGLMDFEFGYNDVPESIWHNREEVITHGMLLGIIFPVVNNGLSSVFKASLPIVFNFTTEVGQVHRKDNSPVIVDMSNVYVSDNGYVTGSISTPNNNIVFFDKNNPYNEMKIQKGLVRLQRGHRPSTFQKGRSSNSTNRMVPTEDELVEAIKSQIRVRAMNAEDLLSSLKQMFVVQKETFVQSLSRVRSLPGIRRCGPLYYIVEWRKKDFG